MSKIIEKDTEGIYEIPKSHRDSSCHTQIISNPIVCSCCNYDFRNDLFSKHELDLLEKMKYCYNCGEKIEK